MRCLLFALLYLILYVHNVRWHKFWQISTQYYFSRFLAVLGWENWKKPVFLTGGNYTNGILVENNDRTYIEVHVRDPNEVFL